MPTCSFKCLKWTANLSKINCYTRAMELSTASSDPERVLVTFSDKSQMLVRVENTRRLTLGESDLLAIMDCVVYGEVKDETKNLLDCL